MKVLYLTNGLDIGGIETNLVRLTEELTSRGHEVIAATRGGTLRADFEAAGGRHVTLNVRLRHPVALVRDAKRIGHVVRSENPDVIHVFSASLGVLHRLSRIVAPLETWPPVVASIMGLKNHPDEAEWITQTRNWLTTWGADRVLLISPTIARFVRRLPVNQDRLVEQPVVGIQMPEVGDLDPGQVRKELGIGLDEHVASTIGRLVPTNSHDLFVDVAARITEERGDVSFLIVGDGPLRADLERKIREEGLNETVHLLGRVPVSDIPPILAATDVYMRPGVVEGFIGITVLEAQSLGVPVVAFETEDVKLAIDDGYSGRLVPAGDVEAMARCIEELLEDDIEAERLAVQGRKLVAERFSIEAVVDGLVDRYKAEIRRS